MSRYIDADKFLIDESEAYMKAQTRIEDDNTRILNLVVHMKIQMLIANAPAEDVVEVKHGRWHKFSENDYGVIDGYYCSECGYRFSFPSYVIDEDDEDVHLQDCLYCEHCGAKMEVIGYDEGKNG